MLRNSSATHRRRASVAGLLAAGVIVALLLSPQSASASVLSLSIDVQPMFNNVNQIVPVFLGILGIGGAIAIAGALVKFVVNHLVKGFNGDDL